jgi:glucose/arabinose dehydrogenase
MRFHFPWGRALGLLVLLPILLVACTPEEAAEPPGATPPPVQETPVPTPETEATPQDPAYPAPEVTPAEPAYPPPEPPLPAQETPVSPAYPAPGDPAETPAPEAEDYAPLAPFEPRIGLELVVEGFSAPVGLIPSRDGTGTLFVFDQAGLVRVLTPEDGLLDEPFLDLRERMVSLSTGFDERGLLGLAFHPSYAENGRFFVYYSAPLRSDAPSGWNHTSHISEFRVSEDDPYQADPVSERVVLQVDQPQANHNAGQIVFGPDGFLYIPLGDGGGANDTGPGHPEQGHGQDITTLKGSILRIDVDAGDPYEIPPDNPFMGEEGRDEIYAYGFRNPFRITFDAGGPQALFAADAGQNLWEEVNNVQIGGNYGWNIKEGTHCFDPDNPNQVPEDCPDTGLRNEPFIDPIIEYPHVRQPEGLGMAVIGGYIYRGNTLPDLQGRYIFGDWSSNFNQGQGVLLVASPPETEGELWEIQELEVAGFPGGELGHFLLSFGQDEENELYVLTSDSTGPTASTGRVYRIVSPEE